MLNFKESVAKVKSAPNFGKMTTIGIQMSKKVKSDILFLVFGVYTGWRVYARSIRNRPESKNILVDMLHTLTDWITPKLS